MLLLFIFMLYWLFFTDHCTCTSYYEFYRHDYTGIVTRKWHNMGTIIQIDFIDKNDYFKLESAFSKELVDNAEVGDTVIKKGSSMICTLKTMNKTMIIPYNHPQRGCNCPDTNKLK